MLTFGNDPMSLNGGGNVGLIPTSALGKPDASAEAAAGTLALTGDKPKIDGKTSGMEKSEKAKPTTECQTCKNRKYQDGSNEMVSFKSAAHISPGQAPTAVRAHEQEHVSNAYKKAAMNHSFQSVGISLLAQRLCSCFIIPPQTHSCVPNDSYNSCS